MEAICQYQPENGFMNRSAISGTGIVTVPAQSSSATAMTLSRSPSRRLSKPLSADWRNSDDKK